MWATSIVGESDKSTDIPTANYLIKPARDPFIVRSPCANCVPDSGSSRPEPESLTVFVPGMSNYVGGFAAAGDSGPFGCGTNYFNPHTNFSFDPNSILEGDVYVVAGDVKHARQVIYDLHNNIPPVDISSPVATMDTPVSPV